MTPSRSLSANWDSEPISDPKPLTADSRLGVRCARCCFPRVVGLETITLEPTVAWPDCERDLLVKESEGNRWWNWPAGAQGLGKRAPNFPCKGLRLSRAMQSDQPHPHAPEPR